MTAQHRRDLDLRESLIDALWGADVRTITAAQAIADTLLTGALRPLLAEAAEATRLRETVARIEELHVRLVRIGFTGGVEANLRHALDGPP